MTRLFRAAAVVALVLGVSGLAGCGDDEPVSADYPAGAVKLQQNVPRDVGDHRLVAVNVSQGRAIVVVEARAGGHENVRVKPGQTVTSDGFTFDVVAIEPGDDSGAPGAGSGAIVVLPADS